GSRPSGVTLQAARTRLGELSGVVCRVRLRSSTTRPPRGQVGQDTSSDIGPRRCTRVTGEVGSASWQEGCREPVRFRLPQLGVYAWTASAGAAYCTSAAT